MNVFGDSIVSGPEGNLQVAKKVVTTVGRFGDYTAEIRQNYELGFTPYRLHTNSDGTFVTPIRVYDGRVYVYDDETTMEVNNRQIATDKISSKLIYFAKGDDNGGTGFALHGVRGPSGAKGLKRDSGNRGVAGSRGPTGKRGAAIPGGPPGKIGKMGPAGACGGAGARGGQCVKGNTGVVGQQGPIGSTGPQCKHTNGGGRAILSRSLRSLCYKFDGRHRTA